MVLVVVLNVRDFYQIVWIRYSKHVWIIVMKLLKILKVKLMAKIRLKQTLVTEDRTIQVLKKDFTDEIEKLDGNWNLRKMKKKTKICKKKRALYTN